MPECPPIDAVCARVAEILRAEREAKKLSLTRLAEGAALSRQAVSYIEQGRRIPTLDTLLRIARELSLDPSELLRRAGAER